MHSTDHDRSDQMGILKSRHLHPVPVKWADPAEDDGFAPCRTARHDKKGNLLRDKTGRVICRCRCVDANGYHRPLHESVGGSHCVFCGERTSI